MWSNTGQARLSRLFFHFDHGDKTRGKTPCKKWVCSSVIRPPLIYSHCQDISRFQYFGTKHTMKAIHESTEFGSIQALQRPSCIISPHEREVQTCSYLVFVYSDFVPATGQNRGFLNMFPFWKVEEYEAKHLRSTFQKQYPKCLPRGKCSFKCFGVALSLPPSVFLPALPFLPPYSHSLPNTL